jgi:hypothetical protein
MTRIYDHGNTSIDDGAIVLLGEATLENNRHGPTERQVQLNEGQKTVFSVFKNYLEDLTNTKLRPLVIVLVSHWKGWNRKITSYKCDH